MVSLSWCIRQGTRGEGDGDAGRAAGTQITFPPPRLHCDNCITSVSETIRKPPLVKAQSALKTKQKIKYGDFPSIHPCSFAQSKIHVDNSVTVQGLVFVANLWFGGFPYPVNPGRPEWSKVQTRGKPRPRRSICRLASDNRRTGRLRRLTGPTNVCHGPGYFQWVHSGSSRKDFG